MRNGRTNQRIMKWMMPPRLRLGSRLRVDAEGELRESQPWLLPVWIVLIAFTALEALDDLHWIGRPSALFQRWVPDAVLAAAALLIFARAFFEPVARRAWLSFGCAMAVWCAGSISWGVVYGGQPNPSYPTFADVLWLLWYPGMAAGLVFLIRIRFRRFEVHRWLDGIGVTLMVLVVGFGFIIQPLADRSSQSWVATFVNFSYPVLDLLLIGALLGIYGLLGWRPDAMWIFIGMGIAACAGADAVFAVQQARGVLDTSSYDFVWTLGALFITYAAWVGSPTVHKDDRQVTGLRAIALALIATATAIAIQIVAIFKEVGKSERVVTALVLAVALVETVLTRPRAGADNDALPSTPAAEASARKNEADEMKLSQ
jgi:diguanylate cyclase